MVMSVGAARSSVANPAVSNLLTRARAIAALARERAQQTEADRRVGDDMIERMRQADLFRIMQPRSYGGFEYGWQDRTALAAGTYAPVGQAVAVDGGYRLSGVGSFCSGCDNAQWQLLGGMIPQPGAAATPGFFL